MKNGHGGVWGYTPRRIIAFAVLINARRQREAQEQLSIGALANCGDGETINKQLREWD